MVSTHVQPQTAIPALPQTCTSWSATAAGRSGRLHAHVKNYKRRYMYVDHVILCDCLLYSQRAATLTAVEAGRVLQAATGDVTAPDDGCRRRSVCAPVTLTSALHLPRVANVAASSAGCIACHAGRAAASSAGIRSPRSPGIKSAIFASSVNASPVTVCRQCGYCRAQPRLSEPPAVKPRARDLGHQTRTLRSRLQVKASGTRWEQAIAGCARQDAPTADTISRFARVRGGGTGRAPKPTLPPVLFRRRHRQRPLCCRCPEAACAAATIAGRLRRGADTGLITREQAVKLCEHRADGNPKVGCVLRGLLPRPFVLLHQPASRKQNTVPESGKIPKNLGNLKHMQSDLGSKYGAHLDCGAIPVTFAANTTTQSRNAGKMACTSPPARCWTC